MPDVDLGPLGLDAAFEAVFGAATLRAVHGPSLRGDLAFDARGQRRFQFDIDVSGHPAPVRAFFAGNTLGVTTRQRVLRPAPGRVQVDNRLKLHFVGSELFAVKPRFWLQEAHGRVSLGGRVRHSAVLPPPLNGIAEEFMAANTRAQLARFEAELRARLAPRSEGPLAGLKRALAAAAGAGLGSHPVVGS